MITLKQKCIFIAMLGVALTFGWVSYWGLDLQLDSYLGMLGVGMLIVDIFWLVLPLIATSLVILTISEIHYDNQR